MLITFVISFNGVIYNVSTTEPYMLHASVCFDKANVDVRVCLSLELK